MKWKLWIFPLFAAICAAQIRIDCGATTTSYDAGGAWLPDMFFTGGLTIAKTPGGTSVQNTIRYGTFRYEIPAPAGSYRIALHFIEQYTAVPGHNVFDVSVDGVKLLKAYDIVADVGENAEVVKQLFVKHATGNPLVILFQTIASSARVAAIEVTPDAAGFGMLDVCIGQSCQLALNTATAPSQASLQSWTWANCVSTNGTAAYTCNPNPAIASYSDRMLVILWPDATNFAGADGVTGQATINISSVGLHNIKAADGSTDLPAKSIPIDRPTLLFYEPTNKIFIAPFIAKPAN